MAPIPRKLLIAAMIGLILACVGALGAGASSVREAATYRLASRALDELGLLAGLVDEGGQLLRDEPLAVEVIADGGPLWALEVVERAVEASPWFTRGNSPHLLRTELVETSGAGAGVALQLHLWRSGWELREPAPRQVRVAVWAAVLAGLLGALAASFSRRISVGLGTAGLVGQALLAAIPLAPELSPAQGLLATWAEGPLLAPLIGAIQRMSALHMAIAAAVLAASLVLVGFDHQRSREQGRDLGLGWAGFAALFGGLGALAWIEAASRGSLFAACDWRFGAWAGWLALLGLIAAWLPAIRVANEARHAQR